MKRLQKPLRKSYKMPALFLDDVENIEDVVKEIPGNKYKLEFGDYEYDQVSEISADIKETNEFRITSREPYISLNLEENYASLYSSDNDVKSSGIFFKIDDIIKRRERKLLWWLSQVSGWVAPPIFVLSLFNIFLLIKKSSFNINLFVFFALLLLSFFWIISSFRLIFSAYSKVTLIKNNQRSNFINRNKDQIILVFLGAAVGSLLTVFFERIFLK